MLYRPGCKITANHKPFCMGNHCRLGERNIFWKPLSSEPPVYRIFHEEKGLNYPSLERKYLTFLILRTIEPLNVPWTRKWPEKETKAMEGYQRSQGARGAKEPRSQTVGARKSVSQGARVPCSPGQGLARAQASSRKLMNKSLPPYLFFFFGQSHDPK